jgi:hypothetical protein
MVLIQDHPDLTPFICLTPSDLFDLSAYICGFTLQVV